MPRTQPIRPSHWPTMPAVPDAWRHREPAKTIHGNIAYYYLHCQRCFKPKGRTNRRLCGSCSKLGPRKIALALLCPDCGNVIDRDELIVALYYAGLSSVELGALFKLSANQVLNVVHGHPSGKHKSERSRLSKRQRSVASVAGRQ